MGELRSRGLGVPISKGLIGLGLRRLRSLGPEDVARKGICMSGEKSTNDPARAIEWLREIEEAAAEIVAVGDLLFRAGKPSDPVMLRRYELYTRVKAAVALPFGPERVTALQATKIGDRKKH